MYIVFSRQNGQSTSMAQQSFLLATVDWQKALKKAREHYKGADESFINSILIYETELDKEFSLQDYFSGSTTDPLVFHSWKNQGEPDWKEEFLGQLSGYNSYL